MKNIALRYAALIADTLCVLVGPLLLFLQPQQNIAENTALATAAVITMILTLLLFMTELIFMLTIEESTYHTVLLSGSILLYMLFSPDMGAIYDIYGLHHPIWLHEILCEAAFLGLILSFFNFLHFTYRPNGKKTRLEPIVFMTLSGTVGYVSLAFFGLQAIAHALLVLAVGIYFIDFAAKCARNRTENINFFLCQIVLFAALGMHTVNVLYFSGMVAHVRWYSLVYIWIGMFCFISIYAAFIIREAGIAQQAKKLRRRAALHIFQYSVFVTLRGQRPECAKFVFFNEKQLYQTFRLFSAQAKPRFCVGALKLQAPSPLRCELPRLPIPGATPPESRGKSGGAAQTRQFFRCRRATKLQNKLTPPKAMQ